jgi:hypothetical protein
MHSPGTEGCIMATAAQRERKRRLMAEAEHPAFQRRGWDGPVESQMSEVSVCQRCRLDVPFLVWRRPHWVCAVCADAR